MSESVFIIGAGRVGTGLGLALEQTPHRLVGMWNRGAEGRARATELLGFEVHGGPLSDCPGIHHASVIMVCVSDAAIPTVATALAGAIRSHTPVIAHTSGCLTANTLKRLESFPRGSMHPLCACPTPVRASAALRRCLYTLEGDDAAVARLRGLATDLSGKCNVIAAENKARYHAAAVLASNLVVALLDVAVAEARRAGLNNPKNDIVSLAMGALHEAHALDFPRALTGPVARGDSETVAKHLQLLDPEVKEIYAVLSRRAVELARGRGLEEILVSKVHDLLAST